MISKLSKIKNIKNKHVRRLIEHSAYLLTVFVLVPVFLYYELCIVLPRTVEIWTISYFVHYFCAGFLLFNIIGNMIFGMFTKTSVKDKCIDQHNGDWSFCSVCQCFRPPRAWHCDNCDICILKRDHHCTFFACCVGYFNHRYFMYFTFYILIAMVYSFYYNVMFLSRIIKWNHGIVLSKFLFPLASFALDIGEETFCIFMVELNVIIGMFAGFLFLYHLNNLLNGKITPEYKSNVKSISYDRGLKLNLIEVFGFKWYITWLSPYIQSPLPGNGSAWIGVEKNK